MFIRLFSSLILSFFSIVAHAAWVDFDQWIDNGTYLTDPVSGYDWLKLTETAGLSFTGLQASGLLDEWTYVEDVAGVGYSDIFSGTDYDGALERLEAWGDTQLSSDPFGAQSNVIGGSTLIGCFGTFCDYSIVNDRLEVTGQEFSEELGTVFFGNVEIQIVNDDILAFGSPDLDLSLFDSEITPYHGHALVRVSPVPVPAAGWLFMTALGGLLIKKRLAR